MHDEYRQVPCGVLLEPCPVCSGKAEAWEFSEKHTDPVKRLIACENGDPIGPQDHLVGSGCLLFMPPDAFYHDTMRSASRYWNEFAKAMRQLREANELKNKLEKEKYPLDKDK